MNTHARVWPLLVATALCARGAATSGSIDDRKSDAAAWHEQAVDSAQSLEYAAPSEQLVSRNVASVLSDVTATENQAATRNDLANPTVGPTPLPQLADGLEWSVWGWVGYAHASAAGDPNLWVSEGGLGLTKTFTDRIAASVNLNLIDDQSHSRAEIEQVFVTMLASERHQTLVTVGRFNADFGAEPRDFWNRLTGTTSLLFNAEPQELTGIMLTQPLGDTGLKARPFIAEAFDDDLRGGTSPAGGLTLAYARHRSFAASMTGWVGPGVIPKDEREDSTPHGSNGYAPVVANAWGPRLDARSGGTLYFAVAKVLWLPRRDITLAAEYLFSSTSSSHRGSRWNGGLFLANYDLNDRWRVFGRWSYLADSQGVVTGVTQRRHEVGGGVGFEVYRGIEMRAEFRHDFSSAQGGSDTVSTDLTFGF